MNEQQAIALVQKTFKSAFDRSGYIHFLKNLLNEFDDEGARSNQGARIPDKFQNYVEKLERVGKYLVDDHEVMLFIVHLKNDTSIERARTMQRNFIAHYLQMDMKDAALVAFVSKDPANWRFSFIKMEYRYDEEKNKIKEEFTPAKRWSFLVGENEASHTAQRKLVPLMDDEHYPTLVDLEDAFNIEKVTKEFFEKYRGLFIRTKEELDEAVSANPKTRSDFASKGIDTVNLAKKLLGQIIFLYYLQKKGWFGVGRDAAWGEGSKNFLRELFDKKHGDYKNFFNDILEPLFYDALRRDRSEDDHYYPKFNCKIPFLNGGLFDPMNNYDWVKTDILLPNELFHNKTKTKEGDEGDGILDIFDRYNFTVKEDEPFEKEVAIDPELLGKAYEKFNAIRPDNYDEFLQALKSGKKGDESKFNKQYGVYYTPREIVHYMCQQSLINYLYSELNPNVVYQNLGDDKLDMFGNTVKSGQLDLTAEHHPMTDVPKEDIEIFILKGEQIKEHDERVVAEGRETRSYPFQMPESIRTHAALIDEKLSNIKVCDPAVGSGAFPVGMMSEIVRARDVLRSWTKTPKTLYDFKRGCIENSLYGVDIDSGAVEIAKLRLWLSLVVDEDDIQNIKPLPNLDYKIVCGNSLIGVEKNLFNVNLFAELETLKPLYFNATNVSKKKEYKTRIDGLIDQITDGHYQFDYEIHFSEVFHQKDGFDVVIGNPPYIGEKGNEKLFHPVAKTQFGKKFYTRWMDYFYYFFHKSIDIGKQNSNIVFITTNYYLTATGANRLRSDIKQRTTIKNLLNFNELTIFESAKGQHNMITILQKGKNENALASNFITDRRGDCPPELFISMLYGNDTETSYFSAKQTELFEGADAQIRMAGQGNDTVLSIESILAKMKTQPYRLGDVCHILMGLVTRADRVSNEHFKKDPNLKAKKGDGIYILTQKEVDNLKLTKEDKDKYLRPYYKNSDISKYYSAEKNRLWILYIKDVGEPIKLSKELNNHFAKYETLLTKLKQNFLKNEIAAGFVKRWLANGNYFVLFNPKKEEYFTKPKIIAPYRSRENTFAYNEISWFASQDVCYVLPQSTEFELKYIFAVLNSALCFQWLSYKGKKKGELLELMQKPLSEIPINKISHAEQQPFIKLVDRILAAKAKNPQADTSQLEREIDKLVYQLYGLTQEEIDIVEGK